MQENFVKKDMVNSGIVKTCDELDLSLNEETALANDSKDELESERNSRFLSPWSSVNE